MVLRGEERLDCKIRVDGMQLEYVLEFKYLGCVLDESGTYEAECCGKAAILRRDECAIRSLVNASGLQFESCMRFACACSYVWQ